MQIINNKYRVIRTFNKDKEEESYIVETIKNPSKPLYLKILNLNDHKDTIENLIENIQGFKNYTHENLLSSYNIELITSINLKEVKKLSYCVTSEYTDWLRLNKYFQNIIDPYPLEILFKIIKTIDYLHFRGIVYKVLNPSNVFIKDKEIKLLNLTSVIEGSNRLSVNSFYNEYIAPEVLLNPKDVDYKADIYSIGMLIKNWSFDFSKLEHESKEEIEKIISICLEKDPNKRLLGVKDIIAKLVALFDYDFSVDFKTEREKIFFKTRLIGRESALKVALDLEQQIANRKSIDNLMIISGSTGTGKTRMIEEILFRTEMRGSISYNLELTSSDTWSILSISNLLSGLFSFSNRDFTTDIENQNLFTVSEGSTHYVYDLSKIDDRYKVFNILIDDLQKLSQNRFVVIGITNLENCDNDFVSIIDFLSSRLRGNKVLFFLTLNEMGIVDSQIGTMVSHWKESLGDKFIEIENLNAEETSLLVKEILGIGYIPVNFSKTFYQESRGNPKYLDMIIKHLFDNGDLFIGENGNWGVPDKNYNSLDYPKSYNDTIKNQIVGYSEDDIELLKVVSAFDSPVPLIYLMKYFNINRVELNDLIDKFIDRRILNMRTADYESVFFVEQELKSYIYDNLILDKKDYHQSISKLILVDRNNHNPYNFDELVFQLKGSKQVDLSLEIIHERISHQDNMYGDTVISLLEQALEVLSNEHHEKELDILFQLTDKTLIRGNLKSVDNYLDNLDRLSLARGKLDIYLTSQLFRVDILVKRNEMSKASDIYNKTEDELNHIDNSKIKIFALLVKSRMLISLGDIETLLFVVNEGIQLSLDTNTNDFLGDLYNIRGISAAMSGDYKVALDYYNLSIEAYRMSQKEFEMVKPTNNIGNLYNEIYGRPKTGLDYYWRSYEISEKYGLASMQTTFLNNIGEAYYTLQDYESARIYLLKSIDLSKAIGDKRLVFLSTVNLGMVYLKTDNINKAIETYELLREFNRIEPILDKEINIQYTNFLGEYYMSMGDMENAKIFSSVSMNRSKEISLKNYLVNKARIFYIDSFDKGRFDYDEFINILNEFENKGGDYNKSLFVILSSTLALNFGHYDIADKVLREFTNVKTNDSMNLYLDDYEVVKNLVTKHKNLYTRALELVEEDKFQLKRMRTEYLMFIANSMYDDMNYSGALAVYLKILDYGYTLVGPIKNQESRISTLNRIKASAAKERINSIMKKFKMDIPQELMDLPIDDSSVICKYLKMIKSNPEIKIFKSVKTLDGVEVTVELIRELTDNYDDNIRLIMEHLMDLTMAKRSYIKIFNTYEEEDDIEIRMGDFSKGIEGIRAIEGEIYNGESVFISKGLKSMASNPYESFTSRDVIGVIALPVLLGNINKFTKVNRRKRSNPRLKIKGYIYLDTNSYINRFDESSLEKARKLTNLLLLNIEGMRLHRSSSVDVTTGLLMREYFENRFDEVIHEYKNTDGEFSVLMMDIDRFKGVNDTYGHIVGDSILSEIGRTILESIRETDYAGRFGGEEFIAILDDISPEDALEVAEKIRKKVSEIVHPIIKEGVTISIGISNYPHHSEEKSELIDKADQALYYAKEVLGRNKTITWNDGMNRIQDLEDQVLDITTDGIIKDPKRLAPLIEIATVIRREMSIESKIDIFLNKVIEGVSGFSSMLMVFNEDGDSSIYAKSIVHTDGIRNLDIDNEDVDLIVNTKRGRILIDWNINKKENVNLKHKDFDSVILSPIIKNGKIIGIVKVCVPLHVKEFTNRDLNYVEVLSSVFSGNLK